MPKMFHFLFLLSGSLWLPLTFAGEPASLPTGTWFLKAELGGYKPHLTDSLTVNNGSNFPAPLNEDRYSLSEHRRTMAGLALGYSWQKNQYWLPKMALGLRYQHFFNQNTGLRITQYSMPVFENYDYDWHLLSDALSLFGKVNLFDKGRFSPYVQAGLGLAINQSKRYKETALPGVTARISPGFSDSLRDQFTYHLGAGLDFSINQKLSLSLGYEFQDLGQMRSNTAIGLWAGQVLNLKHYQTQSVVAGLTYGLA